MFVKKRDKRVHDYRVGHGYDNSYQLMSWFFFPGPQQKLEVQEEERKRKMAERRAEEARKRLELSHVWCVCCQSPLPTQRFVSSSRKLSTYDYRPAEWESQEHWDQVG